ncbi:MAG: hypothetical protein ACPGXK_07785 [Phycisphaerae bacterium]
MVSIVDLWLPILLSAVFVFIVSSIIHMATPMHKSDWKKLNDEDSLLRAMRDQQLGVGRYMFPCPDGMADLATPAMQEKYNQGPVGFLTVVPDGPPSMGKPLITWFSYSILIGVFAGYVATLGLERGAAYSAVFRMTGTIAFLAYGLSDIPSSIWKGQSWWITIKFMFDGLLYGLVTAGTFGWLWPADV